jgi:hypothetical protein
MEAEISECGKYRYTLKRRVNINLKTNKPCLFIMLNPSTADHRIDDPTIKKCYGFAERESCTSLTVVNLFAFRATDPNQLLKITHSHRENQNYIFGEIEKHRLGLVIVAWGSHEAVKYAPTGWIDLQLFRNNIHPKCFKINKDGNPKHPLYVGRYQPLIDYSVKL